MKTIKVQQRANRIDDQGLFGKWRRALSNRALKVAERVETRQAEWHMKLISFQSKVCEFNMVDAEDKKEKKIGGSTNGT